eukprot:1160637-Amphidinium_carterae.2
MSVSNHFILLWAIFLSDIGKIAACSCASVGPLKRDHSRSRGYPQVLLRSGALRLKRCCLQYSIQ